MSKMFRSVLMICCCTLPLMKNIFVRLHQNHSKVNLEEMWRKVNRNHSNASSGSLCTSGSAPAIGTHNDCVPTFHGHLSKTSCACYPHLLLKEGREPSVQITFRFENGLFIFSVSFVSFVFSFNTPFSHISLLL